MSRAENGQEAGAAPRPGNTECRLLLSKPDVSYRPQCRQNLASRHRQTGNVDPALKGILDGRAQRRAGRIRRAFTDRLDAKRIVVRREYHVLDLDLGDIGRTGHKIIHQTSGQNLAIVVEYEPLTKRDTKPLCETARNLAFDHQRIQGQPAVVDNDIFQDRDCPRLRINLDDGDIDPAAPDHGVRIKELRRIQARTAEINHVTIPDRTGSQLAERHEILPGARDRDHAVVDDDLVFGAAKYP